MSGQCVTAEECTNSGGTAAGNCASAFGVCCFRFVEATMATQTVPVDNDFTHIQNQGFPNAVGNAAVAAGAGQTATNLMFPIRGEPGCCSIRLDFVAGVFSQPTAANGGQPGACRGAGANGDSFTVATNPVQLLGFNTLCGTLTGQHIYIETGPLPANPAATVNIITGTNTFARTWKILVRRLSCTDPNLPPAGAQCLQFFTGVTDTITSFNGGIANPIMLNNLNYNICIRPGVGTSGLTVREAGAAMIDSFGLLDAAALSANSMTGSDTSGATPALNCPMQGISIPNALNAGIERLVPGVTITNNMPANPPNFCGGVLNSVTNQAAAGPVVALDVFGGSNSIGVFSDNSASAVGTGFNLIFTQF